MKFNAEHGHLISFVDQLTTAVKETFQEKGYDVDISIAVDIDGGMIFEMDPKSTKLTQEFVDSVIEEAVIKIGGTHEC